MRPDLDVAIIGGGAAGMMAALQAAHNPELSIAVFEKSIQHRCNTQVSSGSLAAGGTRFQAAAGVEDSPERHADDIIRVSGDESSRPLVEAVCQVAPDYVHWLADALDYPMEIGTDMVRGGMSVPRLHSDVGRQGGARLVRTLREAIARMPNIAFVDSTPGVGLVSSGEEVTGVVVRQQEGETPVSANAVVLASDGFAANSTLLAEHCPDAVADAFGGVSTSTGDALAWAIELGAATGNMGSFLGHGLMVPGHSTRLNPALPFRGALLMDLDGRRFVDEHRHGYSSLGAIIRQMPDRRAVMVWSERMNTDALHSELMRESAAAGAYSRFDTLEALCAALHLPQDAVAETIGSFVSRDDVTGWTGQLEFPLYASGLTSGILTTQGGLVVDTRGRVLTSAGSPIPGLYAGGGTAIGISGPSSTGYSSGNGLLSALGLGWIIGRDLAAGVSRG